jgi:hypothetical protein
MPKTHDFPKLVVCIISCLKNKEKMGAIRNTWVKNLSSLGIDHYFVLGDEQISAVQIKNDILYVPVKEVYENLPKKVTALYEYIIDKTKYNYVFKIDDDCFVNTIEFEKIPFWNHDYLGHEVCTDAKDFIPDWHFGKCHDPEINKTPYDSKYIGSWCGGGFGYFLSQKAMKILKANKNKLNKELYEDKAVGDVLRNNGILLSEDKFFTHLNPYQFQINPDNEEQFKKFIDSNRDILANRTITMELKTAGIIYQIAGQSSISGQKAKLPINLETGPENILFNDKETNSLTKTAAGQEFTLTSSHESLQPLATEISDKILSTAKHGNYNLKEQVTAINYTNSEILKRTTINKALYKNLKTRLLELENKITALHDGVEKKREILTRVSGEKDYLVKVLTSEESKKNLLFQTVTRDLSLKEQEIVVLIQEKEKLLTSLKWYQDTFENRKLAGIIKDRVLSKTNSLPSAGKEEKLYEFDNILCTIVNHKFNENARKLRDTFSKYVNTIVIDSGSPEKDESFINLPNVYYSGLFNYACAHAKKDRYPFIFFICSDVVVEEEDVKKIFESLKNIDFTSLGIYSPSSKGRSHLWCQKHNNSGIRIVPFVEGFIFLASMEVLEEIAPIDSSVNLLGWGIDVVSGYFCKSQYKLCLIDDVATVFHPAETGYSSSEAEVQMEKWVQSFNNSELQRFYSEQIGLIRLGFNSAEVRDKHTVSVIIPCYNQATYLTDTINALFDQEYCAYELIIINDGSTDNTDEIASSLAKKYSQIKYIKQKNSGLGAARNTGLRHSSGTYIQFLDADDILSPDKIMAQVNDFLTDPSIDISYTNYLCFDDTDREKEWIYSRVKLGEDAGLDLIKNWEKELSIPVHCFLFKKSSIEGIFFDESLPNHEDWSFHLQVAARKLKYIHTIKGLAYYRVRAQSMARDMDLMMRGKKMALENIINQNLYSAEHLNQLYLRIAE